MVLVFSFSLSPSLFSLSLTLSHTENREVVAGTLPKLLNLGNSEESLLSQTLRTDDWRVLSDGTFGMLSCL